MDDIDRPDRGAVAAGCLSFLFAMLPEQRTETYQQTMVSGCDRRLRPGSDGLNVYGAAVHPRAAIPLSSCTCSSPSERAFTAGKRVFEQLRCTTDRSVTVPNVLTRVRDTIRRCLELPPDTEIALTPSGTDVELLALALIAGTDDREIVNIIVGPHEVGSGTLRAASACHYDTRLPRGCEAVIGEPVNAAFASRVTIERVDVRDQRGRILAAAEVDIAVTEMVAAAVARGAQVVLH
ncbi:MAG: hypothetical protein HKN47_17670, partial [Pirellulaceae bacterium]|nr:hypothetical protein [Pirellulaceae bacterium]